MITAKKARKKALKIDRTELELSRLDAQIKNQINNGLTKTVFRFIYGLPDSNIQRAIKTLKKHKYKVKQVSHDFVKEFEIKW